MNLISLIVARFDEFAKKKNFQVIYVFCPMLPGDDIENLRDGGLTRDVYEAFQLSRGSTAEKMHRCDD